MQELIIKYKKLHEDAIVPLKKDPEDAGWDLYAIEDVTIPAGDIRKIKTGIALGIPKGYRISVRDRSSVGGAAVIVTGGVIDRGYTGELFVNLAYVKTHGLLLKIRHIFNYLRTFNQVPDKEFNHLTKDMYRIAKGDRIAQFLLEKDPQFVTLEEVDELEQTNRGGKGFGSSGK